MTQPRDVYTDALAELTRHVHPDWMLVEARLDYLNNRAWLLVQDKTDATKRLKDHYHWDGHAWILGASHTA